MEKHIYYLSNTVIPNTKREKNIHVFNVFTRVGVKQLTDFLRTVTAASDLVDCTLVNCDMGKALKLNRKQHVLTGQLFIMFMSKYTNEIKCWTTSLTVQLYMD